MDLPFNRYGYHKALLINEYLLYTWLFKVKMVMILMVNNTFFII